MIELKALVENFLNLVCLLLTYVLVFNLHRKFDVEVAVRFVGDSNAESFAETYSDCSKVQQLWTYFDLTVIPGTDNLD